MARLPRSLPTRGRQGFSFLELIIGMSVLLVALLIFSSSVSGVAKQRTVNRETNLAVAAARNLLETLRSEEFAEVYALYNTNPGDDPGGAGTAPGNRFVVAGLDDAVDSNGFDGEIVFPDVETGGAWQLREDLELPELGMPRDLSGDSIVDDRDHAGSYFILPVLIRLRWRSPIGTRQYEMTTQLCQYNKS